MEKVIPLRGKKFYLEKSRLFMQRGLTCILNEENQEAKDHLLTAYQFDPQNAEAIYMAGYVCYLLGDYIESLDYIEKAVQLNQENVDYQFIYGLVLLRNKKHEQGEFVFQKILKKEPNHTKAKYYLGKIAFDTHQYKKALVWYKGIEEQYDEKYALCFEMASCYAMMADYEPALAYLMKTKEANPQFVFTYELMSNIYLKQAELQKAIDIQYEKLKHCPNSQEETKRKIAEMKKIHALLQGSDSNE